MISVAVRSILALIVGFVTFGCLVALFDGLAGEVSGGTPPKSLDEYLLNYQSYPANFFLVMMLGWLIAAFVGVFLATALALRWKPVFGGLVGTLGLVGTAANLWMLPHPNWLWSALVLQPIVIGLAIVCGQRFGKPRNVSDPLQA